MLSSVLRYAASTLTSFIILFIIIFGAFVQMTYLMFSYFLYDFSTFVRSAETMFALMLGKYNQ